MEKIILIMIGLIIATIGVMCVFDARIITKKIFGFLFSIAGTLIIYFNI